MSETVLAARTLTRVMPDGTYVRATAKLTHLNGNDHPYFSVTGEQWESPAHYRRRTDRETGLMMCGCIHEIVAEAFPELAPVIALHLADDSGAPMYAVENGWYWYSDCDGRGTDLYPHQEPLYSMTPHQRGAHYLRVTPDELPEELGKEEFREYVETLRGRWEAEAARALELLEQTAPVA